MKENTMLQVFALDKDGRLRFVEEVARGLACQCSCPSCGESVVAKQGEIRGWHFAHVSGIECLGSSETALHLAAKQILLDEKGMMVPEVSITVEKKLSDGRVGQGTSSRPEMWIDFFRVETEQKFGEIRPDVVAFFNDGMMFIEIAVTHFVNKQKSELIAKLSVPTLEVDLSELQEISLNWQSLKSLLIDALHNKLWVHAIAYSAIEAEAIQFAMNDALAKPLQSNHIDVHKRSVKYRYIVNSRTVYLTEHSYCARVWIQPDMSVVNVVKPMLKDLGGNYKKYTNDWWFPIEASADLHAGLATISSRSAEVVSN